VIQIKDKITILVAADLVAVLEMPILVLATCMDAFFGGGGRRGPRPRTRAGQDAFIRVEVDLMEATFGCQRDLNIETAIACNKCQGTGVR
jgi:DnaJ-class molecular chaperone